MKPIYVICLSLGLIACSQNTFGQKKTSGQFEDLNFEQATIVSDPSNYLGVYVSDAIPGWTVGNSFLGTNDILYDDLSLGAPSVTLCGPNPKGGASYAPPPLDGNFSIDLYGGVPGENYPQVGVSLSQTASVPAGAQSILFIASSGFGAAPLLLSLGGQNISYSAISIEPDYTLYGGNIPAFGDQIETLTFNAPIGVNNYWELDDIQFSSSPVPEPDVLSIFGIGTLLFCRMRNLRRPFERKSADRRKSTDEKSVFHLCSSVAKKIPGMKKAASRQASKS